MGPIPNQIIPKITNVIPCEICILAGGLSSRMGRNKARLRLGKQTLLRQIKESAAAMQLPIRVIRKDLVPRSGPLGGIYTALRTTSASAVLFLACDMPFVRQNLLESFLAQSDGSKAVFSVCNGKPGFPLLLQASTLHEVEGLLAGTDRSLYRLAQILHAKLLVIPETQRDQLFNVNTPADWKAAQKIRRNAEPAAT